LSVLSAAAYYAASVSRLVRGLRRPHRVVGALLGRRPFEVELRRTGLRFRVRSAMDVWVVKETCLDDAYLPPGVRPGPGWSVVDVGAGIGDFTVLVASQCPAGVVHAYEPLAESFDLLRSNVAANGLANVVVRREAVASRPGAMAARLEVGRPAVEARFAAVGGETAPSAPARDLAAVLDALPGGACDLLKLDCEGCEFDVLLGSPPALLRRVRRVSLEAHDGVDGRAEAILDRLRAHGFAVRWTRNPVHRRLSLVFAERLPRPGTES
jgi:FkbM family methyltransferase